MLFVLQSHICFISSFFDFNGLRANEPKNLFMLSQASRVTPTLMFLVLRPLKCLIESFPNFIEPLNNRACCLGHAKSLSTLDLFDCETLWTHKLRELYMHLAKLLYNLTHQIHMWPNLNLLPNIKPHYQAQSLLSL